MSKSKLEEQFAVAWKCYGNGMPPLTEYQFATSVGRRFRFDYAWPDKTGKCGGVAVEIDGGQWTPHGGRHATDADRTKLNFAACLGWRVLRFSGSMLCDPEGCVNMVVWALS